MLKNCFKCQLTKSIKDFYYRKDRNIYRKECKSCHIEQKRLYYKENKDKVKASVKRYYQKNRQQVLDYMSVYSKTDKERTRKRLYMNEYEKRRKTYDKQYHLSVNLRKRLYVALKKQYKTTSAVNDLGCSLNYLKKHLESKFTDKMNWENYGSYWHIDHIKPLSSFDLTNEIQAKMACHYTNLQPLEARENIIKSNKVDEGWPSLNRGVSVKAKLTKNEQANTEGENSVKTVKSVTHR